MTEPGTGLARVKTEPSWSAPSNYLKTSLNVEEASDPEEFPGLKKAAVASFNEVHPADLNFVLAWSRREHERKEEKQRLLEQAACYRNRVEHDVIVLDDNDKDEAGTSRRGDDGAGITAAVRKDDDNGWDRIGMELPLF